MIALVIIAVMAGFLIGSVLITLSYDIKIYRLEKEHEKLRKAMNLRFHEITLAAVK